MENFMALIINRTVKDLDKLGMLKAEGQQRLTFNLCHLGLVVALVP